MDAAQHNFSLDTEPDRITCRRSGRHVHGNWILRHNGRVVWTGIDVRDALAVRNRIVADVVEDDEGQWRWRATGELVTDVACDALQLD